MTHIKTFAASAVLAWTDTHQNKTLIHVLVVADCENEEAAIQAAYMEGLSEHPGANLIMGRALLLEDREKIPAQN